MSAPETIGSCADGDTRRKARRGLIIYFAIVVALSVPIEGFIISNPDLDGLTAVLMLVPAIASVVARLVLREGFADVSFRFGGRRGRNTILQALVFPVVIGLVAYGIAWTTGLARFDPPSVGSLAVPFAVGFIVGLILASGEEIGWRGYMLTRLIDAEVPRPVLASGLIWGLWHVPLVLAGVYAAGSSPVQSAALILVSITSFGYVISRMRLETGSVWPAIVLHAAWNRIIQGPFDGATTGAGAPLWVGESGILTALTLVVAAVIYSRGRWTIIRTLPKPEKALARHSSRRCSTEGAITDLRGAIRDYPPRTRGEELLMSAPNIANWVRLGLLALPLYGLLTFWTTLDPQPDPSKHYEAWSRYVSTTHYVVAYVLGSGFGTILAIFGVFALGAYLTGSRAGRLGLVAMVITVLGQALFLMVVGVSAFSAPAEGQAYLAGIEEFAQLSPNFASAALGITGLLAVLLGFMGNVLLGLAVWRSETLPKWAGAIRPLP